MGETEITSTRISFTQIAKLSSHVSCVDVEKLTRLSLMFEFDIYEAHVH